MQIRIKNGQDFATGLLFLFLGIAAYYIGSTYNMGNAQRPGTGVLPRILAWCLIGSGVLMWIKAFAGEGDGIQFSWRPVVGLVLAPVTFLLLVWLDHGLSAVVPGHEIGPVASMTVALTVLVCFMPGTASRPLVMVTAAAIAFSLLIDRAGMVVAMIVSMTLAALGTPETRWREFAAFMVLMLAIGLGIFIYGLGMPIKVLPWN
jgi:hypothetical protein